MKTGYHASQSFHVVALPMYVYSLRVLPEHVRLRGSICGCSELGPVARQVKCIIYFTTTGASLLLCNCARLCRDHSGRLGQPEVPLCIWPVRQQNRRCGSLRKRRPCLWHLESSTYLLRHQSILDILPSWASVFGVISSVPASAACLDTSRVVCGQWSRRHTLDHSTHCVSGQQEQATAGVRSYSEALQVESM